MVSATTRNLVSDLPSLLWFAWKFVPLWYQQQHRMQGIRRELGCDLLENSYLCGISNNPLAKLRVSAWVVICLKIRTFVVSATTLCWNRIHEVKLWFAWKFVPLWYQQQPAPSIVSWRLGCDLLENSYLCGISNNTRVIVRALSMLWFAWKFVPLWYQQQQLFLSLSLQFCCDLLENSYLCGISNNHKDFWRLL